MKFKDSCYDVSRMFFLIYLNRFTIQQRALALFSHLWYSKAAEKLHTNIAKLDAIVQNMCDWGWSNVMKYPTQLKIM